MPFLDILMHPRHLHSSAIIARAMQGWGEPLGSGRQHQTPTATQLISRLSIFFVLHPGNVLHCVFNTAHNISDRNLSFDTHTHTKKQNDPAKSQLPQ